MTVLAVLLSALVLVAPAASQEVNAPPGNSGVDEYLETVPGAGGNRPSTGDADRSPLAPGARGDLEGQGADGRAAAELAERVGPRATKAVPAGALPTGADGSGPVGALGRATTGSDEGMGMWLPILLILAAAVALAVAVYRRRRTQQP